MKLILRGVAIVLGMSILAVLSFLTTAHGQGSILGGIVTYNPENEWVLFTDKTGTWHAPLAITNSAAPSDSVVEFTVNTDDQFVIQTYAAGTPTSLLDVDVDGSAALYGSAGGGIGVDANSGDTCIPSTRPSPCSPTSLRVASSGVLTQYLGQPTAGNGMPTILYYADTSLSGGFGPYTIFTTNASGYGSSGLYRLTGYMTVTAAASGSTMQFQASYYDESGLQSQTSGAPTPFQSVGEKLPFSFVFYSQPSSPISVSMVTLGGSPTYTVHLRLEGL